MTPVDNATLDPADKGKEFQKANLRLLTLDSQLRAELECLTEGLYTLDHYRQLATKFHIFAKLINSGIKYCELLTSPVAAPFSKIEFVVRRPCCHAADIVKPEQVSTEGSDGNHPARVEQPELTHIESLLALTQQAEQAAQDCCYSLGKMVPSLFASLTSVTQALGCQLRYFTSLQPPTTNIIFRTEPEVCPHTDDEINALIPNPD
jgi:hypothetical protein